MPREISLSLVNFQRLCLCSMETGRPLDELANELIGRANLPTEGNVTIADDDPIWESINSHLVGDSKAD